MKGDMGGAACVVATVMAIAQLECPISVVGLVPLCENMPSGNAVKPGDIVTAMNGKTITVSSVIYYSKCVLFFWIHNIMVIRDFSRNFLKGGGGGG